MAGFLLASFYVAMAASAYLVEFAFGALHLTPPGPPGGGGAHVAGLRVGTTPLG